MGDLRHHETSPRAWSPAEHKAMWELRKEGLSLGEISRRMGRPISSISGRLKNTDENGNFLSRSERRSLADLGVDDLLLERHKEGWTYDQIGESVGFKATAIRSRIRRMLSGESAPVSPDRKERPCICCRKPMISDQWDHRRCKSCLRNQQREGILHEEWSLCL